MKIDPYYHRRRCSPMTLDSGNIRFVRIFPGVPWRWGIKRQWGNQKSRFSGLSDATSSIGTLGNKANITIYYQSILAFPLTPKCLTLSGHFTFNFQFSLLRTAFRRLGYILIVELFIEYFLYDVTSKHVRKRTAKLRSAENCGNAKGLRILS